MQEEHQKTADTMAALRREICEKEAAGPPSAPPPQPPRPPRPWLRWLLLLGVLLLAAGFGYQLGKIPPDTIVGRVVDLHGLPVPGAVVGVEHRDLVTRTDRYGRFSLHGVPPGKHSILIELKPTGGVTLEVEMGKSVGRDVGNVTLYRP